MAQTLDQMIANARKASKALDGTPAKPGQIEIHVTPASFVSTGVDANGNPLKNYNKGDVVRQIRCGGRNRTLTEDHVAALFAAFGVTDFDGEAWARMFALKGE